MKLKIIDTSKKNRKNISNTAKMIKKGIVSNKQVKIYLDKLLYSPFDFKYFTDKLKMEGIIVTKSARSADIIASSYLSRIRQHFGLNKKYLLWTHEPYHDYTYKARINLNNKRVNIMNVYTGGIYQNNYRYFYYTKPLQKIRVEDISDNFNKLDSIQIPAFSTKYPITYYAKNKYTILPQRYQLIEWGHKQGFVKIWGKGWPENMIQGESRNNNRIQAKKDILQKYYFNISLENAVAKNYVTEKIWEAIVNYCLPIYYGAHPSTIYQDFPENSFIDCAKFKGPEELYNYIQNMSQEEYVTRMNKCIDTFNRIVEKTKNTNKNRFYPCPQNKNLEKIDYGQSYPAFLKLIKNMR